MAKVACDHCQLTFDASVMLEDHAWSKTKYFCCKGCQGIYHLLSDEGLDGFYAKKGDVTLSPVETQENDDLAKFDLEGFQKRYVKTRDDGFSEIHLIIEGIHCSACVWLNEKVLYQQDGIVEASINYSNNKAKVLWDEEEIQLSHIIEVIRSIGYNAYPYDPALQEERAIKQRKEHYAKLLVGIFATMNIMWLAIAQYAGYFSGSMRGDYLHILNLAEWALATPALFYTGQAFYKGAYYGLKNKMINMDFLVATGASLAYIYSIYATLSHEGEVYFDSVTMIITFVFVGKYLEVLSKKRAVDTLDSLRSSFPTEVMVVKDNEKTLVSVEEVQVGDIIELKAGDKCVIDGRSISGEASFDESSLSGESRPIFKEKGATLTSGSMCIDAVVRYEVSKPYAESTFSTIVSLLEDAVTKKPRIEKLANHVSGYFSVTILGIAVLSFAGWMYFGYGFERSLIVAISVIVIACPCALGLATPVATLMGVGIAAKRGILFKEAEFFETMANCDTVLLDKTGTLTEGKPMVVNAQILREYDQNVLYSFVSHSTHPVSYGIKAYLESHVEGLKELDLEEIKTIQASGISAFHNDVQILGGNQKLMDMYQIDAAHHSDDTVFYYAVDGKLCAFFELRDNPKEGAYDVIRAIKAKGLDVAMLTGDHDSVAQKIAQEVGIQTVYSQLMPQDKASIVDEYHARGKKVIMVGDGINDSIALSKSDIAVAMGAGTDVAISVSDVVLLDDKIDSLKDAILLSKKTYFTIKENLGLSLLYNLIAVPTAVLGYVAPFVAALSMSLSSLLVITNSMRIKWYKK